MTTQIDPGSAVLLTGFHAVIAFWIWFLIVGLHAAWRFLFQRDPNPLRPSGPTQH